jgi:ketosteroid isomerase-like protein
MQRSAAWIMVAFIATAVAAQTTRQARVARSATQSDSEKQIMQIERNARQASLRNDITFFEQTMADDYFGIGPAGDIDNKERAITERKSGALHWESIAASEESVRVLGDVAIATGLWKVAGTLDGHDISGTYRYTRIYLKNHGHSPHGRWNVIHNQITQVRPVG